MNAFSISEIYSTDSYLQAVGIAFNYPDLRDAPSVLGDVTGPEC